MRLFSDERSLARWSGSVSALPRDAQVPAEATFGEPTRSVHTTCSAAMVRTESYELRRLACARVVPRNGCMRFVATEILIGTRTLYSPLPYVLSSNSRLSAFIFFRVPQELQEPSKKLAARVRRFFSSKKGRLSDIVPRFVVVDGMERQAATSCIICVVPGAGVAPDAYCGGGNTNFGLLRLRVA